MKTITFTAKELTALNKAIEISNDITTDTLLENVSFDLFPKDEAPVVLTKDGATILRQEIYEATDNLITIRMLMAKLGLHVNDNGYSI